MVDRKMVRPPQPPTAPPISVRAADDHSPGFLSAMPKNVGVIIGVVVGGMLLIACAVTIGVAIASDGNVLFSGCAFVGVAMVGMFASVPVVIFCLFVGAMANSVERDEKVVYEALAKAVHGRGFRSKQFWWQRLRAVEFKHGGLRAIIDQDVRRAGDDYVRYTRLTLDLPQRTAFQCEIVPQGVLDFGLMFGSQDVRLGWPAFDDTFKVRTSQEAIAPRVLDRAIQERLLELKVFSKTLRVRRLAKGRVELSIDGDHIRICVCGRITKTETMLEFHKLCTTLIDQLVPRVCGSQSLSDSPDIR